MRPALLALLFAVSPIAVAQTARYGGDITDSGETYADPDDPDWTTPAVRYTVDVAAGQTLVATLVSENAAILYPRLVLESPSGAVTDEDRAADDARAAVVQVDDAEGGAWTAIATCQGGCDGGYYTLVLDVMDEAPPPTVFEAAAGGDLDAVRAILADEPSAASWTDGVYRTPLMHAASGGHVAVLRALLDAGAEVDAVASGGANDFSWDQPQTTALHDAARGGHPDAVALLLEAGADPNALALDGETPLHLAVYGRSPDVVRLLIEAGADGTAESDYGTTPAQLAATDRAAEDTPEGERARLVEILALLGAE